MTKAQHAKAFIRVKQRTRGHDKFRVKDAAHQLLHPFKTWRISAKDALTTVVAVIALSGSAVVSI